MVAILLITDIFIFFLSSGPIDVHVIILLLLVVKVANNIFSSIHKQLAIAAEGVSRRFVGARSHEGWRLFWKQLLLLGCQRGVIVV